MDDGSEDGSAELLLARAGSDPRLRVVRTPASWSRGRPLSRARGGPRSSRGEDGCGRRGTGAAPRPPGGAARAGRRDRHPRLPHHPRCLAARRRRGGDAPLRGVAELARRPRRDGARPIRRVASRPPLGGHEDGHIAAARRLAGLRRPRGLRPVAARFDAGLRFAKLEETLSIGAIRRADSPARTRATRPALPRAEARGARPGRPRRWPGGRRLGGGAGRQGLVARRARRGSRGERVRRGGPAQGGGTPARRPGRGGRGGRAPARAAAPAPRSGRRARGSGSARRARASASWTASTSSPSPSGARRARARARYNRRMVRRLRLGCTLTAVALAWPARPRGPRGSPPRRRPRRASRGSPDSSRWRTRAPPARASSSGCCGIPTAGVRRRAALAAGRVADPALVPPLVDLMNDQEVEVRRVAAFALGLAGDRPRWTGSSWPSRTPTPGCAAGRRRRSGGSATRAGARRSRASWWTPCPRRSAA